MSFPDPVRRQTLQERVGNMPKAPIVGAAVLLAASLVGVVAGFSTCSPQPAFTVSMQDRQGDEARDAASGTAASDEEGAKQADDGPASREEGVKERQESAASAPATVAVYVSGAVENPGVYEVAEGSRVCDALEAAGGMRFDAAEGAVNLARKVSDGEQIVVPTQEQADAGMSASAADVAASPAAGASSASAGLVNINVAGVEELDTLAGIGPATAQAIVDEREANGPFSSIEDIQRVSGIGEKKFEKLKGSICV